MEALLERERRLDAPAGFQLGGLDGEPQAEQTLRSTYLDTLDYRLARAGITLRHRVVMDTGKASWQLKLPSGTDRVEVEAPGPPGGVPEELSRLLRATVRDQRLHPVATLVTHRTRMLVRRGGVVVAEVVGDRVGVVGTLEPGRPFAELEVELREAGTARDLERITRKLQALGARDGDGRPKLARALDLELGRPHGRARGRLDPRCAFQLALQEQLAELVGHDPGTRLDRDPDQLHDMRVAVRRLRAILRTSRPLLGRQPGDELRAELKRVGQALGAVRDLDVLIEHIRGQRALLPPTEQARVESVAASLGDERREARAALLTVLEGQRYLWLLDRLDDLARPGKDKRSQGPALGALAKREHRRLAKAVGALPRRPSDAELHRVRVKTKRARYAAELAQPSRGKVVRRYIDRAKRLQDVLGDHQDAVVAERRIVAVGRGAVRPAVSVTAGRLAQLEVERRASARADAPAAWRALRKQARRTW